MKKIAFLLAFATCAICGACGPYASPSEVQAEEGAQEYAVGGLNAAAAFPMPVQADLARAACAGNSPKITDALRRGADPNYRGHEGVTALLWALHCNNMRGVESLLTADADPNIRFGRTTPVCFAAAMHDPSALRLLLAHHGDPNARYIGGDRALEIAFNRGLDGHWENYYALLEAGADINGMGRGFTIAEWAADMNAYDKVEELLRRGYRVRPLNLGLVVQDIRPEQMDPIQIQWAARVRAILEQRGVHFPVSVDAAIEETRAYERNAR